MIPVCGRYDYAVELVPYDDGVVARFEQDRAEVANALGLLARAIEPIGSRLVPGIVAKPITDLLVLVGDRDAPHAAARLARRGFQPIRLDELSRTMLRRYRAGTAVPDLHVHLVGPRVWAASPERAFYRLLRDHPEVAEAYSAVKRLALGLSGGDPRRYSAVKGEFIEWVATTVGEARG
ncbi:GrpB family protein [Saccharothrix obliqua]|uniref:GrpB family protein n=1 Tax=Saccharothrix obliqua TaxID=2861747 RepID=UPI001C5F7A3B|nr:GrpB family protein [Saccharothrix obliqua]MBW4718531.1 GrpB family protein [Saccharothrix obliqua]